MTGWPYPWPIIWRETPSVTILLPTLILTIGLSSEHVLEPTTDITNDLISFSTHRGRMHELDRLEAGTATFLLRNFHGYYWPNNTASPYYPYIKPLRSVRLQAFFDPHTYGVFFGFIESLKPKWLSDKGGMLPVMEMKCVDATKDLVRATLNSGKNGVPDEGYAAELSGYRVADILDGAGWPTGSSYRSIDAGQYILQETGPLIEQSAMDQLFTLQDSEGGLFFFSADGVATYNDADARNKDPYKTSQATFSDTPGNTKYMAVDLSYDDQFVFNNIRLTSIGGITQEVSDLPSIQENGLRTLPRSGLQLQDDADVLTRAEYLLSRYRQASLRCQQLTIFPQGEPNSLYPKVLGYDISMKITLQLNSARNPANLDKDYHIEGIEHECDLRKGIWQTRWQLRDADIDTVFKANGTSGYAGYVENYGIISYTYNSIHEEASAQNAYNASVLCTVGQAWSVALSNYWIYRGGLVWDTSTLGAAVNIDSAEIWIYGQTYTATLTIGFYLVVISGDHVSIPNMLVTDYGDMLPDEQNYGSIHSDQWNPSGWNRIPLTAAGIALINKTGLTAFGLRTIRDIDALSPRLNGGDGEERLHFDGEAGTHPPQLIVRLSK